MNIIPGYKQSLRIITIFLFFLIAILPVIYMFISTFSLENYLSFFGNSRQIQIFTRTIVLGAGTAALSLVIGLSFAFIFEYIHIPCRNFIRILSMIPLLIPPYISAIAWMEFLGRKGDIFRTNMLFDSFDIYNLPFAIFLMSLSFFPLVTLISSFALRNVDSRLEDAARLIYSPVKTSFRITLPLILPHALISSLFVFIFAVSEFGVPSLLRVNVFVPEIFAQFSAFFDTEKATALSFPLLASTIFLILFINAYIGRKSFVTISSFSSKRNLFKVSPLYTSLIMGFIFIVLAFSVFIPLLVLLIQSRLKFMEAFALASAPFFNTIWLAVLGATGMVVLGFFISYFISCFSTRLSNLYDPLILLPVAVPSTVIAIGLIRLWNTDLIPVVYGSFLIIIIGYMARFLPFVVKTLSLFFGQIHPSIEEAARLPGAKFPEILRRILLPLMRPGIITAWVVGFVLSLRELGVTLLVSPAGLQTLPSRIYILMHSGSPEIVASLSLMLVFLILAPGFIILIAKTVINWNVR